MHIYWDKRYSKAQRPSSLNPHRKEIFFSLPEYLQENRQKREKDEKS